MYILNILQQALHHRALDLASRYHRCEAELIEILQKIEEKGVFRALGYSSVFQYAVEALHLSEGAAYNFITVARKARQVPQIQEEIKAGNLSVTTARKISPVISPDNAGIWLEKAKTLPRPQLEREVAKSNPQVLTPERSKYVSDNRMALQLGVSPELYEKLKRVKDLLSQKQQCAVSLEDALAAMTDLYLEKHDPLVKAQKATAAQPSPRQELVHGRVDTSQRKALPAAVRHGVILRDGAQCRAPLPDGSRCGSRRWLQFHHVHGAPCEAHI